DSEAHLHGDLNLPHRRVEKQARNNTGAGRADGGSWSGKLRVVERVEELELQLVLEALPEPGVLHERQVGLGLARVAEDVAAGVAVSAGVVRRGPELGQVEPVIGVRIRRRYVADPIRTVAGAGREQGGLLGHRKRQAGAQKQDAADLPATGQLLGERIQVRSEPLAPTERELINPTCSPEVLDIEVRR